MPERKYDPAYVEQVIDMFRDGSSITRVACQKLGIHRDTYYDWKNTHPDFKRMAEIGEGLSELEQERRLEAGAMGEIDNYNSASQIFLMKARYRKTYGEHKEHDSPEKSLIEKILSGEVKVVKNDSNES